MLKANDVPFTYREYTADPLTVPELRQVLAMLGVGVRDVLRPADARKAGFSAKDSDEALLAAMAEHPRMLQRPIGLLDGRAELGRPPENLLRLLGAGS